MKKRQKEEHKAAQKAEKEAARHAKEAAEKAAREAADVVRCGGPSCLSSADGPLE